MSLGIPQLPAGIIPEKEKEDCKEKKEFYTVAAKELIQILCNSVYDEKGENLKDHLRNSIVKKVNDILEDPNTEKTIRDDIFGKEDSDDGLRGFIRNLFRLSSESSESDRIYPFTGVVLQKLFNEKDQTISNLLEEAMQNNQTNDVNGKVIMGIMLDIIKERFKIGILEIKGGTDLDPNTIQEICENKKKKDEDEKEASLEFKETKEGLSQDTSKAHIDLTKDANKVDETIISRIISDSNFEERIQTTVKSAISEMLPTFRNKLYNVTTKVLDKYNETFLDNNEIKLQILYSILSYNEKNDKINTLSIANKLFEDAINEYLTNNNGNPKKSFIVILNELLMKKMGNDNSLLTNIIRTGGKKKSNKRTKKKYRATKSRRVIRKKNRKSIHK